MFERDADIEKNAVVEILSFLAPEQVQHLQQVVSADPMMQGIMDTLLVKMTEFSGTGPVDRPGTSGVDPVPARLEDGEFVFSAKAVEVIGADTLQKLMEEAEAMAGSQAQQAASPVARTGEPSLLDREA